MQCNAIHFPLLSLSCFPSFCLVVSPCNYRERCFVFFLARGSRIWSCNSRPPPPSTRPRSHAGSGPQKTVSSHSSSPTPSAGGLQVMGVTFITHSISWQSHDRKHRTIIMHTFLPLLSNIFLELPLKIRCKKNDRMENGVYKTGEVSQYKNLYDGGI